MAQYYVSKAGNDANNGSSWALAKLTIAGANAVALSGDTINIGAGTFTETGALGGVSGAIYTGAGMFSTIISGSISSTYYIANGISNLKVVWTASVGAYGIGWNGGGTFTNCYFDFSSYPGGTTGYGVFGIGSNVTLKFSNCIFVNYSNITYRCLFMNLSIAGSVKLYGCVFYNSSIEVYSGGAGLTGTNPSVITKNCVFHSVRAKTGSDGLWGSTGGSHSNNCFYNTNPSLAGILSTGEFIADPLFVNAASGDLRLQASSPCIGKGTLTLP